MTNNSLNSVVILGPAYPLRGGIANLNEALCDNLIKSGINSEVVSFSLQYPSFLFPGTTQYETSVIKHPFKITPLLNSVNPLTWIKAVRYIKKINPQLVIVRYWLPFMAPCLGYVARKLRKHHIRVIAITDNVIPHENRIGDKSLTKYFIGSCDAFIVMSEKVKQDIEKFTKTKPVQFTPHPVYNIFGEGVALDTACEELNLDKGKKYILFFGFIRHYKGLDLLIEAMQFVDDSVHLLVAGEFYEDKKPYDDLIHKLQLESRVHIADGYIPKEKVKYYFSAADLVVQPYREATQSGVTQIAYSFNKPMIVTNVGGLPEIVTDGVSGFVTDTQPQSIANAINTFYTNNLKEKMEAGAASEKNKFGWAKMISKITEMFHTIDSKK